MFKIKSISIFILSSLFSFGTNSAQKIENIHFEQVGKQINIYYDLIGIRTGQACNVQLYCSTDGGETFSGPLQKLTGDVGKNISEGIKKKIIWDVLSEKENLIGNILFEIQVERLENNEMKLQPKIVAQSRIKIVPKANDFIILGKSPYGAGNPFPEDEVLHQGAYYKILIGVFSKDANWDAFGGITPITVEKITGTEKKRYFAGKFSDFESAKTVLTIVRKMGFNYAHIESWYNGNRFSPEQVNELQNFQSYSSVTNPIDADGNIYKIAIIDNQTWMAENLKTTKYYDGTAIPIVYDSEKWTKLNTPGYCWYDNNPDEYKATYGALYNWHTVATGKLCPFGWHVPTDAEWTTLTTFLVSEGVAGGKLKEMGISHWVSPNIGATDEWGFTALPGGARGTNGRYGGIGNSCYWWSSSVDSTAGAWYRYMEYFGTSVFRKNSNRHGGLSVRCLKDN